MKTTNLIAITAAALLGSCSLIKDAATVTIDTNLLVDVPVALTTVKSAQLDAQATSYPFSANATLDMAENDDVSDYLKKIKSIDINSVTVTITGLQAEQVIESLTLTVTGVGEVFTQTNITSENNTFSPEISSDIIGKVEAKLESDKKITMTVSGLVNVPVISFLNGFDYGVTIKANALD
jgi:hypothetical protein